VERLLRELDAALTVTVAKDATLGRELEALASRMGKTVEVLGWVDNLPALLQRSHVVIGKAGGALVQETLAAGTPMLITHILPGQEAGNARLLLQHGCGALAPTTEAALQVLTQWFRNGAEAWHRLHRNASALGRPDAARCSARWVLEHLAPASAAAPAFGVRADRNTLH
jgi:processive 1,2-diacylglycerol beta-glucosyltransferase